MARLRCAARWALWSKGEELGCGSEDAVSGGLRQEFWCIREIGIPKFWAGFPRHAPRLPVDVVSPISPEELEAQYYKNLSDA